MITRMKRRIILIFTLAVLAAVQLFPTRTAARAASDNGYAVAVTDKVWFYTAPDEACGLFILPLSYYVKIIEEGEPFCKAEYGDGISIPCVTGYCKSETLTRVDYVPARPYLCKQVTLTYTLDGTLDNDFDSLEKNFYYYGSTFRGTARYWYVYADGKFGFVAQNGEPEYELNVDYLTAGTSGTAVSPAEKKHPLTGVQIALICIAVCAFVSAGAFLFFKRKPHLPVRPEESDDFV